MKKGIKNFHLLATSWKHYMKDHFIVTLRVVIIFGLSLYNNFGKTNGLSFLVSKGDSKDIPRSLYAT